jgi:Integrase zinc binding domain
VVITTSTAKETIGNTPAPSVLSQFNWKHLAPLPEQSPSPETFKSNTKAPRELYTDALSQPSGANEGKDDNQQMTMIPEAAFIRLFGPDSDGSIKHTISIIQNQNWPLMEEWTGIYPIEQVDNPDGSFWRDTKNNRLVIPPDQGLKHGLMNTWHEGSINGHPRRDETIRRINREYFWPGTKTWITEYIKGCATCQQNKNLTHRIKTPMFWIPSSISAKPFSHIAMCHHQCSESLDCSDRCV